VNLILCPFSFKMPLIERRISVEDIKLKASPREVLGKKTRFLRRQGITPVHLFGHGLESLVLQCDTTALQKIITQAGTTRLISLELKGDKQPRSVFVREVQREACSGRLLHIDFYQVSKTERMKSDVPIVLVGEAPALKTKGRTLLHGITFLSVECLPDDLPPQIEVDLSTLAEAEDAIHVKDIVLSESITVNDEPDQLVVKVAEARVEIEAEAVAEEAEVVAEEAVAEAPAEEETSAE
jgi:large subunit ribosomal protein L25